MDSRGRGEEQKPESKKEKKEQSCLDEHPQITNPHQWTRRSGV